MLYEEDTHYFLTHTSKIALKSKGVRQLWHSYHAFFPPSLQHFFCFLFSRKDQLIPMRAAKL